MKKMIRMQNGRKCVEIKVSEINQIWKKVKLPSPAKNFNKPIKPPTHKTQQAYHPPTYLPTKPLIQPLNLLSKHPPKPLTLTPSAIALLHSPLHQHLPPQHTG